VQNLDKQRYEAIPIRIEKDGRWLLADRLPVSASAAEVIEHGKSHAGRLARGEACDPAALDANYIRRSDAELALKV